MSDIRIYDKINYQTNITNPKTFAILLKCIKEEGVMDSNYARETAFPQAKSKSGMSNDPNIRDTHGEITLDQYGLIEYVTPKSFKLSPLGEQFLELFDMGFDKGSYYYTNVMLDALLSWRNTKKGRDLSVGITLIRLLLDDAFEGYITAEEWSYFCENTSMCADSDFEAAKSELLKFRESGNDYQLKKADVLLGGYAGSWGIFKKSSVNGTAHYSLTDAARDICISKFKLLNIISNNIGTVSTSGTCTSASDKIGENILLYGVPGAGKSFTIKNEYCNDDKYMKRVVFHPDYSYSDFVGQILPQTNGERISYPFIPGPFTEILRNAVNDKENHYYLIIEEINRGNAPAIFGELFQLLDRVDDAKDGVLGESMYGINNADIANKVYNDKNRPVKIPANLTILATMNTADQNVFTLDTAFKRRWNMSIVKNDIAGCKHANHNICGRNVTWAEFATRINNKIIELGEDSISSEDNRLGAYFVKPNDLDDSSRFAEKVLMYLWTDAFKYDRTKIFSPVYKTLEDLIVDFEANFFDVFNPELGFDNSAVSTQEDGNESDSAE